MKRHYPYLIVGGGMTGDAAARGIRQVNPDAPIGLIGQEPDPPYNRPPLSKGLWKPGPRPMPLARIWRKTENLGVELHLGRTVVALDAANKQVTDDQGDQYTYGKLLLATGGNPVRLNSPGEDALSPERVIYFRTLADYRRVRVLTEQYQRFAVIGGGFIGSEMAASLSMLGKEVVMIFPEAGICDRVLPPDISHHLIRVFEERGIRVRAGQLVRALQESDSGIIVSTVEGEEHEVDGIVAGLGIRPNTSLAKDAGLTVSDGIEVNSLLRTSHPDIYAAGDVANFYNPTLNRRMRAEHEENANLSGMTAGQNMAGLSNPYYHLPSVYSSLFEYNYDAVGELNPALDLVYKWEEPLQKGTVYYLKQGHVRGVLLWNVPRGLDAARELIADTRSFRPEDLR